MRRQEERIGMFGLALILLSVIVGVIGLMNQQSRVPRPEAHLGERIGGDIISFSTSTLPSLPSSGFNLTQTITYPLTADNAPFESSPLVSLTGGGTSVLPKPMKDVYPDPSRWR